MRRYKIDVVIPTYHPGEKLVTLIQRLLKQTYPVNMIHIVDTETGRFPEEVFVMSDRIKVTKIQKAEFDHGGTRRMAAQQSRADIVIFMTQDAMPYDDKLLEELLKPFENNKVAVTYARQIAYRTSGDIEEFTRKFNYPDKSKLKSYKDIEQLGIKTFFCSDVCAAYRKNVYNEVGGFPKHTIFSEDSIIAAKILEAGYLVGYVAEAKVWHSHKYNCIQQFKRNYDLAVSHVDFSEIFDNVKAEHEGIRLIKETVLYLWNIRKPWLIFVLIMQSGFKYVGYIAGKNYRKMPIWMIMKCTSNKDYWKWKI